MQPYVISSEKYCDYLTQGPGGFRAVSPRVEKLQDMIFTSMKRPKQVWRDVGSILDGETVREPLIVRKALAKKRKLETVPIGHWPGQLIAGSFTLNGENLMLTGALPTYATDDEIAAAAREGLSVWSIVGHIVPDYQRLLTLGTRGIREQAARGLERAKENTSRDFYRAVLIALEGLEVLAARHARFYENLAAGTDDPVSRRELGGLAADLRRAPLDPPETLSQALNSIWLTHLALQICGNYLAIGRIDQHVNRYLEQDLATGRLDAVGAQELFDCFLLKFNERSVDNAVALQETDTVKVQENMDRNWSKRSPFDHSTQKFNVRDSIDATNHWLQNVILGGVKPDDGSDAANLATIMCLEAFRHSGMTNPCVTVRLHRHSPPYLLAKVAEVLSTGGGLPAIFNDETIIPSLAGNGFPLEAARDYTNDGCWEVIVGGRTDFYFDRFNMLKCLEWTLNRGRSRVDGKEEAPDPGEPRDFSSFDQVLGCFQRLLDYELQGVMDKIHSGFGKRALIAPTPLLSALLDGPVENGMDMTAGGARFITYGLIAEGVSHLIDSLAAIKKVVFEDRKASMAKLIDALDHNFHGYEDLRRLLRQAPKYGNNDPYTDCVGRDVLGYFTAKVRELNERYDKINFLAGVGTFSWYIAIGEGSGPSPDGRLMAEEVGSNFSPSAGASRKGITGAILSHAGMSTGQLPVGSPLDLRLGKRYVSGEGGKERLVGLLKTFVELGGNMMTLTVADTETLRQAQQNPDRYRDLRVRMGGWSAYFTMLSKEQQEHHISKEDGM